MQEQSLNLSETTDPFALFADWIGQAGSSEPNDPNAMALATVDASGMPNVRMVLLKDHDPRGFTFYTNRESAKGGELAASGKAAICFHWKSLRRQVRVRGTIEEVTAPEADAYFASRHPTSRRGAWASAQSRPLVSRSVLEDNLREVEERFPNDDAIPRPSYWTGFRIAPDELEFWQDGANRLHDRFQFTRSGEGWAVSRLNP